MEIFIPLVAFLVGLCGSRHALRVKRSLSDRSRQLVVFSGAMAEAEHASLKLQERESRDAIEKLIRDCS